MLKKHFAWAMNLEVAKLNGWPRLHAKMLVAVSGGDKDREVILD